VTGALQPEMRVLAPTGERRISANPHANGGLLLRDLDLPAFPDYAVAVKKPGIGTAEATRVLGTFLRDVIARNPDHFRIMGPDETASNRLNAVFEATNKVWMADTVATDEAHSPSGRVIEVLSEHLCQGWLEGYLLTGRHGLFNCYEAFIHIVDSMLNQRVKWLSRNSHLPWRRPIASLNYPLTSHVWRQDHNGASHQDPGFIDHVANKRPEVVRVYLPPDANTLLSVADHCLRSRQYVNVIVAGKQPALTYLTMDEAIAHCTRGLGIWEWASNSTSEPDGVLAYAGDVPTLETLAAADILRATNCPIWRCGWSTSSTSFGCSQMPNTPRIVGSRVRCPVHHRQAGHLRLPRLPVADPSTDLSPVQSRAIACPRLQRARDDHHSVRHGDAQRPGVPPCDRRHRPRRRAGHPRRCTTSVGARRTTGRPPLRPRTRRG
jgi:phosphoketolase